MNTLWWVMGASAVGKKTLIRRALAEPSVRMEVGLAADVRAIWMNEGPIDPDDVTGISAGGDVLLRWQFGREASFGLLGARRAVLLVIVDPAVHYTQMLMREGARWTSAHLAFEAHAVRRLAEDLARIHAAPLRIVDASGPDYRICGETRAA